MENQITVTVAGANRVELVSRLRAFADNLDGRPAETTGAVTGKTTATRKVAPPPAKKAAAAPVDEDDDDFKADTGESDPAGFDDDAAGTEEEGFEDPPPPAATKAAPSSAAGKKGAKPKKLTIDDVNDACKAHAAAKGRPATLQVLQQKFKTQSVTALKPEQFAACIQAMAVD